MNNISYKIVHELENFISTTNDHVNKVRTTPLKELLGTGILDKLDVWTHGYNTKYIKKYWSPVKLSQNRAEPYIRTYSHKTKEHLGIKLSLKISSKENTLDVYTEKKHAYKVSLNPSKFKSLSHVEDILEKILGKHKATSRICRIDFSILLNKEYFDVTFFNLFLSIKDKSISTIYYPTEIRFISDNMEYKSGIATGLVFGGSSSRLSIYDVKNYTQHKNTFKKKNKDKLYIPHKTKLTPNGLQIINFEYQLRTKHLSEFKIENIEDLKKLRDLQPFKNFNLINPFQLKKGVKKTNKRGRISLETLMYGYFQMKRIEQKIDHKFHETERDALTEIKISDEGISFNDFLNQSFNHGMLKFIDKKTR